MSRSSVQAVARELSAAGLPTAVPEARWLVQAADEAGASLDTLISRRLSGEPLQYITGLAGFRRLDIAVGPGVFIPRPETEILAGHAIEGAPSSATVVDLCTGSGAVALALADERPDLRIYATELSLAAYSWAQRNRARLGLPVELLKGSLFEPLPGSLKGSIGVVVSNPPYISPEEAEALPQEVREHEPHEALFAPGHGLSVLGSIIREAKAWLSPDGLLLLEIAPHQAGEVTRLLEREGYVEVVVERDLTGRERVVRARWG